MCVYADKECLLQKKEQPKRNNLCFSNHMVLPVTSWVCRSNQLQRAPCLQWGCRAEHCSYPSATKPQNLLLADDSSLGVAENSRTTQIRAVESKSYMVRHPGHFTSMKKLLGA